MLSKKVSLIMPLYNAEEYVESAIESILNQTYQNFELILIDDVSTDATMQKVSRFSDSRINILHNDKNRGIAYSRNRGLEVAQGEYIALMDDDDISLPERFEKQVSYLNEHPEIDFLGGRYQIISEQGQVLHEPSIAYKNPLYIKALFLFQDIFSNGEMMFRKETVKSHDIRYADNQYGMEDFKFWIECSKVGCFTTMEDVIFQHRVHEKSETIKTKREKADIRRNHRKELVRYSMRLSNILLDESELEIVYRFTSGEKCTLCEDLKKYYDALGKIVKQAYDQRLDFAEELDILCRKHYMKEIRNVDNFWRV